MASDLESSAREYQELTITANVEMINTEFLESLSTVIIGHHRDND